MEKMHFKDGKVNGTWKQYDTDGSLWSEKEFYGDDDNFSYTRYNKN